MAAAVPRRRALIAYAAGVAVIASLMTVVALGGGVISAKRTMPQHTELAAKQP